MPKQTKNNLRAFTPHYFHNRKLAAVRQSCAETVSTVKSAFGKNSAGFTLVEVVVVMAIISIMAGVLIVSLGRGRVEKELEANARAFVSVVREAQNYALTGKQISGNTACAFYVTWTTPSTYSLKYTPSGACAAPPTLIANHSLKHGVTFVSGGSAVFVLPWANTSKTQANFQKSGSSHVVCIDNDGRIFNQTGASCP